METSNNNTMEYEYVTKRNGDREKVYFDKINYRIEKLCEGLKINPTRVTRDITKEMYNGIHTWELDELGAQIAASLCTEHPDYNTLASRIIVSNHHKNTSPSFSETMTMLYNNRDIHGNHSPLISRELFDTTNLNAAKLNDTIKYERDYYFDYFGFKTLERSYLMRLKGSGDTESTLPGVKQDIKGRIVERPQHMFMRVSLGIHGSNIRDAINTYNLMSNKYFIHATPTLFNAGTRRPQLSSCFLLAMKEDSIDGIYSTLRDCALISKWAGGIGLHVHNIRAKNSAIRGTNGISNGLVPMLRVFNNTARYVDQCLIPDTIIYTSKGPKPICEVVTGETQIYNLKGELETVSQVLEHEYSGEILEVNVSSSIDPLIITPQHPVYSITGQSKGINYNVIRKRLERNLIKPDWVEAGDLTANDFVGFPIPQTETDISSITMDDCYMYGLILGDGSLNKSGTNYGYLSLNSESKRHIIEWVTEYFKAKFIDFRVERSETRKLVRIYWNKSVNLPFQYSDFYMNHDKHCSSRFLNLPIEKSSFILKGLIDTDGSIGNEILFDSTSRNLIESVRLLCLRMGALTGGYKRDRRGESHITKYGDTITNKLLSFSLRIPKTTEICNLLGTRSNVSNNETGKFFKFFRHGDILYSRIKDINSKQYNGVLYDLQMPNEHNYLVHSGLVHNGGGKRNGSIAIYLEPWHADIFDFLLLKKNHGNEEDRARDLFYALYICDLFMKRVREGGNWTLFCPDEAPGLSDTFGDEFEKLYTRYEEEGRGKKTIEAQKLWTAILESQIETGTPYMVYKDACNRKSNQQNLGVIKSSNLCTEIVEYSDREQFAVCNLASIGLPRFVGENGFDFTKLEEVVKVMTRNLNKVIDINFYPVPETKRSNTLHRPIGLGVQGLADVFAKLGYPFASEEARKLNNDIFETIYYASMTASMELSREREEIIKEFKEYSDNPELYDSMADNETEFQEMLDKMRSENSIIDEEIDRTEFLGSYSSYIGSPLYNGKLQFDLWERESPAKYPLRHNWDSLRSEIKKYGVRNSLLLAPMPTASTSQILGNNECFEPFTTNIYIRRTLAGEFIVINNHLINELIKLGVWNNDIKNRIIEANGSIQGIEEIPDNIRNTFKTVWETSNKVLIDMAADRGRFICQSQSLNLFVEKPNFNNLSSMHMYAWKSGLKTGLYYLRTRPVAQAQKFTIEPGKRPENKPVLACSRDNPDCEACSA